MKQLLFLMTCLLIGQFNQNLRASSQPAAAAAGAGAARAQTAQSKAAQSITPAQMLNLLIQTWLPMINPPPSATNKVIARLFGLINEDTDKKDFKKRIDALGQLAPTFLNQYPFLVQASPDQSMVEFLVNHGAPINQQDVDGNTALHKAVDACEYFGFNVENSQLIKFLIKHGANPDIKNRKGWSVNDKLKLQEEIKRKQLLEQKKIAK
jgi:hypothetical protein